MRDHIAFVREESCIGCAKCIAVCPTDAIVGAKGFSHTVVAALCIACDLCLPPCPMDCIDLIPRESVGINSQEAKIKIQSRLKRLAKEKEEQELQVKKLRVKTSEERKMEIARMVGKQ